MSAQRVADSMPVRSITNVVNMILMLGHLFTKDHMDPPLLFKQCLRCGHHNRANREKCWHCGYKFYGEVDNLGPEDLDHGDYCPEVQEPPVLIRKCARCGATVPAFQMYCFWCVNNPHPWDKAKKVYPVLNADADDEKKSEPLECKRQSCGLPCSWLYIDENGDEEICGAPCWLIPNNHDGTEFHLCQEHLFQNWQRKGRQAHYNYMEDNEYYYTEEGVDPSEDPAFGVEVEDIMTSPSEGQESNHSVNEAVPLYPDEVRKRINKETVGRSKKSMKQ